MQLHGHEGVPQYQLQALRHVALAVEWTDRMVAHVGALKQPPNDLTQGKDAGDRAIVEPADEETLHIRLPAPHHPLGESLRVGRRRHQAAMERAAGRVARNDLRLVAAGRFAQVDPFAYLEGICEVRLAHAEPSLAEPR
jgi:hypothetical protein